MAIAGPIGMAIGDLVWFAGWTHVICILLWLYVCVGVLGERQWGIERYKKGGD